MAFLRHVFFLPLTRLINGIVRLGSTSGELLQLMFTYTVFFVRS